MTGNRLEVMKSLEGFVSEALPDLLPEEDAYWQPADLLPDMREEDAFERVAGLQKRAAGLSDDLMVVLIGDMITEEALPTYASWIVQLDGFDKNGEPRNAWGDWLRRWTAEENRHGDALNRYLYLTGRVNMREVEVTVQNLLSDGGDPGTGADPYKAFVYTSFQEIATRVSHKNVAVQALKVGEKTLGKLCNLVAGDEARHARAYKLFFSKALEMDTNEALLALRDVLKAKVTMPAMYMRERGKNVGETFKRFAEVAERTKVYTSAHYGEILGGLLKSWGISDLTGLCPEAEAAQDYICGLPERYRKLVERMARRMRNAEPYAFSWLAPAAARSAM